MELRVNSLQTPGHFSSYCTARNHFHYLTLSRSLCRAVGSLWADSIPHFQPYLPHSMPLSPWAPATIIHEVFQEWSCAPRSQTFCSTVVLWSVYLPPFSTRQTPIHPSRSSSNIPSLWNFLWSFSPHLGSWWPPAQSSHCPQYLPPSLQAALSLFLSDIPLATIPCLRIHCRQILCAASPPARQMPPPLCRKH